MKRSGSRCRYCLPGVRYLTVGIAGSGLALQSLADDAVDEGEQPMTGLDN
jgi:hypothetical protein